MAKRVSRSVVKVLDAAYGRKSSKPKAVSSTKKTPTKKAKAKPVQKDATQPQPHAKARWLHHWGQFSDQLPKKFKSDGGHNWMRAPNADALSKLYAELRNGVLAKWPGTTEWTGDTWARWMRPDGEQMTVEFVVKKK